MTQFIDLKLITAVVFLFIVIVGTNTSFEKKQTRVEHGKNDDIKSNKLFNWLLFAGVLIGVVFIDALFSKLTAEGNIKSYMEFKVLRCKNDSSKYRVSKQDGWEVDGFYFIKDSLMIRANKCERL